MELKMQKIFIYLARLLSACCFYLFLAKANTWLNATDNTIMVFGYRCFIIIAPLFLVITKRWIAFLAFAISAIGIGCYFSNYFLIGTILFSSGMAVGGFVLKYYASKTPTGAANNRIALNLGGVFTGIIMIIPGNENYILWIGLLLIAITLICSLFSQEEEKEDGTFQKTNFSISSLKRLRGQAWALTGIVTGIKLAGLTSILPQYLIEYYGALPAWYGGTLSLSCVVVIVLQLPIMKLMERLSLNQALLVLLFSMLVVASPKMFLCHTILGAMLWVFLLTLFECAVSYLDVFSREEGSLLIKEFCVGIGMGLTVFFMRSFSPIEAAFLIGCIGFFAILIGMKILTKQEKTNKFYKYTLLSQSKIP